MYDSSDMTNPSGNRKSGRQRVSTKKYPVDSFEGLDALPSGSDKDGEPSRLIERDSDDVDFSAEQGVAAEAEAVDEDELMVDESSEGSMMATSYEEDEEEAASSVESEDERELSRPRGLATDAYSKRKKKKKNRNTIVHSRGCLMSKSRILKIFI